MMIYGALVFCVGSIVEYLWLEEDDRILSFFPLVFTYAELFRMYGQTECQRVCYLEPGMIDRKPTSIGRAIPGTEAFVLNEDGGPVAPGEVGVLHVRGPHLMAGYWRQPELTAHHLR